MRKINTDNLTAEIMQEHIGYLARFMSEERMAVLRKVLAERTGYITVCLENIYHGHNASAVLRSCEAFGIQHVHVIEDLLPFEPAAGIVRGTDKWLDIDRYGEANATENVIRRLKADGFRIVATSPHAGGVAPDEFDVEKGPVALFVGTERHGLSETALRMADEYITIPMCGFVESLNLSVCTAIVLSSLTRRMRASETADWRLPREEAEKLLYTWTLRSVKDAQRILMKYEREK